MQIARKHKHWGVYLKEILSTHSPMSENRAMIQLYTRNAAVLACNFSKNGKWNWGLFGCSTLFSSIDSGMVLDTGAPIDSPVSKKESDNCLLRDRNKALTYSRLVLAVRSSLDLESSKRHLFKWRCVATSSGSYMQEVANSYTPEGSLLTLKITR